MFSAQQSSQFWWALNINASKQIPAMFFLRTSVHRYWPCWRRYASEKRPVSSSHTLSGTHTGISVLTCQNFQSMSVLARHVRFAIKSFKDSFSFRRKNTLLIGQPWPGAHRDPCFECDCRRLDGQLRRRFHRRWDNAIDRHSKVLTTNRNPPVHRHNPEPFKMVTVAPNQQILQVSKPRSSQPLSQVATNKMLKLECVC